MESSLLFTETRVSRLWRGACVFARVHLRKRCCKILARRTFARAPFLDFRSTPGYNFRFLMPGGVAQLGERLNGIQEVRGSIPLASIWAAEHAAQSYQAKAISH